ncbi:hypothetical protein [Methylobacterium sp. Leaf94]|uniref:hypothetical protein n=1 Tax=Methylobacterium sp. Leaf94 TaxID=1736250 RepID=UPI0012E36431|nr:hypothetical protein [Methylobacterium sp. Leaf94]
MSASRPTSAAAREREANRVAQAETRARRAQAGRPDPAVLDRAIADALAQVIARAPQGYRLATPLDAEAILWAAAEALRDRTERAIAAGKPTVVYRREAVAAALAARLGLDP